MFAGAGEKKTRSWAVGGERVEATCGIGRMDGPGVWHNWGLFEEKGMFEFLFDEQFFLWGKALY